MKSAFFFWPMSTAVRALIFPRYTLLSLTCKACRFVASLALLNLPCGPVPFPFPFPPPPDSGGPGNIGAAPLKWGLWPSTDAGLLHPRSRKAVPPPPPIAAAAAAAPKGRFRSRATATVAPTPPPPPLLLLEDPNPNPDPDPLAEKSRDDAPLVRVRWPIANRTGCCC